jgi:hypothetical protein
MKCDKKHASNLNYSLKPENQDIFPTITAVWIQMRQQRSGGDKTRHSSCEVLWVDTHVSK